MKKRWYCKELNLKSKICGDCGLEKEISNFNKSKNNYGGFTYNCKSCIKIYNLSYRKDYEYNRYHNDVQFKLTKKLRGRMKIAIKKNQKSGSAVKDLGCTISELKNYLESKFSSGMTWENWGTEWHIDHIVPLVSFSLENREQFLKACHYTNLQPLQINDHIEKTIIESKERKRAKQI